MSATIVAKLTTPAEKKTGTTTDVIEVTDHVLQTWHDPDCQRPLRINDKMRKAAEVLKKEGVIKGTISLGRLNGKTYLLDGKHRREVFRMSGLGMAYADIRIKHFDTEAEMAEEFLILNGKLASMRPDDTLRALEVVVPALKEIRAACPFVDYDNIRRSNKSPVIGMSQMLRCWRCSASDTPTASTSGNTGEDIVRALTPEEIPQLIGMLHLCLSAFGRDEEYYRLWSNLNMTMCMWIYRRLVLAPQSTKVRSVRLTKDLFRKCLMSLSANGHYLDWLVGRTMSDRDRSPAYTHIRASFVQRLKEELPGTIKMPQPAWSSGGGGKR